MLAGYFSHQQQTFGHLRNYYLNSFGVRLVPFNLDYRDHRQLEHVLEDWAGRLTVGDPLLAHDLEFMDAVANE